MPCAYSIVLAFLFDHCGRLCCLKYTSTCIRYLIIGVMHWHPLIIVSDPREDVLTWIRFKNKNGVIESYIINKNNKNKPKKMKKRIFFLVCVMWCFISSKIHLNGHKFNTMIFKNNFTWALHGIMIGPKVPFTGIYHSLVGV